MEHRSHPDFWSEPTRPEIRAADTVEDPDLRFMLDHWRALRGDRRWPRRTDFVPRAIKRCLRMVHIYELVDNGADFRARLIGTGVFPGLAADQTGKLVSEHPDPGVRLRFGLILTHVVKTGEPARSLARRFTGPLLHDARTEGLWLPLGLDDRLEHVLAVSSLNFIAPGAAGA